LIKDPGFPVPAFETDKTDIEILRSFFDLTDKIFVAEIDLNRSVTVRQIFLESCPSSLSSSSLLATSTTFRPFAAIAWKILFRSLKSSRHESPMGKFRFIDMHCASVKCFLTFP